MAPIPQQRVEEEKRKAEEAKRKTISEGLTSAFEFTDGFQGLAAGLQGKPGREALPAETQDLVDTLRQTRIRILTDELIARGYDGKKMIMLPKKEIEAINQKADDSAKAFLEGEGKRFLSSRSKNGITLDDDTRKAILEYDKDSGKDVLSALPMFTGQKGLEERLDIPAGGGAPMLAKPMIPGMAAPARP